MKRKYFLRGVGIGILITTVVFILAGKQKISDEEVIRRAEELGYVKQEETPTPAIDLEGLLDKKSTPVPTAAPVDTVTPQPSEGADVTEPPEPSITPEISITSEPSVTPEASATPGALEHPDITDTPDDVTLPVPSGSNESTSIPEISSTPVPDQNTEQEVIRVEFRVKYGTSAGEICNQLEAAGIIDDASGFRKYLAEEEIDDTIRAGLYIVSSDMTYEELANVLRRQDD